MTWIRWIAIWGALALVACGPAPAEDAGVDPTDAGDDSMDAGGGDDDAGPGREDAGPIGTNVGAPCDGPDDCPSGICFPTGFGTSVCTEACADTSDCVDGWECGSFGGGMACTCATGGETCDGADEDCDGLIDEGDAALLGCAEGETCEMGGCTCPAGRMCGGECIDVTADPLNCGDCDVECPGGQRCADGACCTPSPETCNGSDDDCDGEIDEGRGTDLGCTDGESCSEGSCACIAMCGGSCVDTRSDAAHCGECGNACPSGLDCVDSICCEAAGSRVDVLFMIDTSNSMVEEQRSLVDQIPRMVDALATGDLNGDGTPETAPVRDLHIGVITPDMGTGGFSVPTCFDSDFGDDGVLRTTSSGAGCMATYPSFLAFDPETDDPSDYAADVACLAEAGTGGCGFEQQLEAVLKSVTASTAPIRFFSGTTGHADGMNAGFLRDDSVLVTILLTDEDDCSASDPDLFNPSSATYSMTDLNLRCAEHTSALHALSRYATGLIATRRDPRDLIFAAIAGIPSDLITSGPTPDYTGILADPRMRVTVDPSMPSRLVPSCDDPARGVAFPPRRIVRTAQAIQSRGGTGVLGSLCKADFSSSMTAILQRISLRLGESCAGSL